MNTHRIRRGLIGLPWTSAAITVALVVATSLGVGTGGTTAERAAPPLAVTEQPAEPSSPPPAPPAAPERRRIQEPARAASKSPAARPPPVTGGALQAVLVGVNHPAGSKPLEGAVNDVVQLRDALVRYGVPSDRIALLTDGQVTHDAVLAAVDRLALAPPTAHVVFAYAGHGRKPRGEGGLAMANGRSLLASDLARSLSAVKAPLWATFLQCYAAMFDVPGIAGPGRVITFAAGRDDYAWESGGNSNLERYMVGEGMLAGHASGSVEQAYGYAAAKLKEIDAPDRPQMDDRFSGDFELGPPIAQAARPTTGSTSGPGPSQSSTPSASPSPEPTPEAPAQPGAQPTPAPSNCSGLVPGVCS